MTTNRKTASKTASTTARKASTARKTTRPKTTGGAASAKRAALYMRVSTLNGQTTDNQRRALLEVAERKGWEVVAEYDDTGISGAKGRDKRPGLDALLKDAARGRFDVVACWAVDRLGRSLVGVANAMAELEACGVEQFYLQQGIDGSTPVGKAMVGMSIVFAEMERDLARVRIKAGLDRARAEGKKLGRPFGWSVEHRKNEQEVLTMHAAGVSKRKIAATLGMSRTTVLLIIREHQERSSE